MNAILTECRNVNLFAKNYFPFLEHQKCCKVNNAIQMCEALFACGSGLTEDKFVASESCFKLSLCDKVCASAFHYLGEKSEFLRY